MFLPGNLQVLHIFLFDLLHLVGHFLRPLLQVQLNHLLLLLYLLNLGSPGLLFTSNLLTNGDNSTFCLVLSPTVRIVLMRFYFNFIIYQRVGNFTRFGWEGDIDFFKIWTYYIYYKYFFCWLLFLGKFIHEFKGNDRQCMVAELHAVLWQFLRIHWRQLKHFYDVYLLSLSAKSTLKIMNLGGYEFRIIF